MKILSEDRGWLAENQPLLEVSNDKNGNWQIIGSLRITGSFDEENKVYSFGSIDELKNSSNFFDDYFAIKIEESIDKFLPRVKEVGGRLETLKKKAQKSNPDMHFYSSGEICIAGPIDNLLYKQNQNSVTDFIREFVQPFFYDQLHYEKFQKWPRGEYLHDLLGEVQNFGNIDTANQQRFAEDLLNKIKDSKDSRIINVLLSKNVKGHIPCLCGSKKIIRKCHPALFKGLWSLKNLPK